MNSPFDQFFDTAWGIAYQRLYRCSATQPAPDAYRVVAMSSGRIVASQSGCDSALGEIRTRVLKTAFGHQYYVAIRRSRQRRPTARDPATDHQRVGQNVGCVARVEVGEISPSVE